MINDVLDTCQMIYIHTYHLHWLFLFVVAFQSIWDYSNCFMCFQLRELPQVSLSAFPSHTKSRSDLPWWERSQLPVKSGGIELMCDKAGIMSQAWISLNWSFSKFFIKHIVNPRWSRARLSLSKPQKWSRRTGEPPCPVEIWRKSNWSLL